MNIKRIVLGVTQRGASDWTNFDDLGIYFQGQITSLMGKTTYKSGVQTYSVPLD